MARKKKKGVKGKIKLRGPRGILKATQRQSGVQAITKKRAKKGATPAGKKTAPLGKRRGAAVGKTVKPDVFGPKKKLKRDYGAQRRR